MSRIKNSLPEDVDITDPNEPDWGNPVRVEVKVEDSIEFQVGYALWDVESAITNLVDCKQHLTPRELENIERSVKRLNSLIKFINKPF